MSSLRISINQFKKGAFIIVEGKPSPKSFFFVKDGKVRLSKEFQIEELRENQLSRGDFFGVISCMSKHPREESAQALQDTQVIEVHRDQFGALIRNNAEVAMKIIRSFSRRLRQLDQQMTRVTGKEPQAEEDPSQILSIAEFYHSTKQYNQALYAYVRYVQYFPDHPKTPEIKNKIQSLSHLAEHALNPNNEEGSGKSFKNNTVIFCEHELGDELYILQQGQVKITKVLDHSEKTIAILKAGDIFGEMAILENKPRSASATAFGDVEVMAVNTSNFQSIVISQPQLATRLITLLSERLWTGFRQLETNMIKDHPGKMLDTLLLEVEKENIQNYKTSHIFPFGPKELTGMVGISQEEGKRAFTQILGMKHFDLADEGKHIHCLDLTELQKEVQRIKKKEIREAAAEETRNLNKK